MAREVDVYQLVRSFAHRNSLSEIDYRAFAQAVQRQARLSDQSEPVFRDLSLNPDLVLTPRLFLLAKKRKLALETAGNEIRSIVLPEHYAEIFFQEYRRMDENPEVPFPDEDSLKTLVPGEWIQSITMDTDLAAVSDSSGERPVPLYRIVFPEGVRPLVVPSAFVPDKLLEYAALKLRQFLRKGGNKEYMLNKLGYAFGGKESQLKDALNQVLTKPYEAIAELRSCASDFTFPFWAYLLSAIKKDLDKKTDKTGEDWATHQAALLCEFYSNFYKGKAQRLVDVELGYKALEAALRKPPYHFGLEEVLAFRDSKGAPLVSKLGREGIEKRLHELSTKAEAGRLPEILVVGAGGRRFYMPKDKALLYTVRAIGEARSDIRSQLVEQWRRLLEEFRSTRAMEEDGAFRAELEGQVQTRFPILDALIQDRLLPLIHEELKVRGEALPDLDRLFYKGDLIPPDELLELSRKVLVSDARMLLPFWYSIPILSGIARFFRRLSRGRAERAAAAQAARASRSAALADQEARSERRAGSPVADRRAEFTAAAGKVAQTLTPSGYSLEEYLRELESRWNTLINPDSKRNLTEDVNSLVRDYLRNVIRSMRGAAFTPERVQNLAATLADSPTLLRIKNHQALEQYLQLYMAKVLGGGVRLD